ncbi:MAG TPA: MFS transporter [Candidatus Limnocylindrales bacterium]
MSSTPRRTIGPFTRPSFGGLWRDADFLKLWTGQSVSRFGSQISLLAIPLLAIALLDATPFEMGVLGAVEMLPFIFVSLPAGAWADRLRKRPILVAGDLGRAVALATIPVAYELGVLTMVQLYVVAFITGVLTVFFDVANQSYLPVLVERDQIVDGNSKLQITDSAASIAGPGVAGVLIGWLTAPVAIVWDAVSFVVSGVFVLYIRRPEPPVPVHDEATGPRPSIRSEIAEGVGYVAHHRYLRSIAAATAWSNVFGSMAWAVLLLYAYRELGLRAEALGAIFAIGNVGGLVGAVAAPRVAQRFGIGRAILIGLAVGCPQFLLIAIASRETAAPLFIASGILIGLSVMVYNINQVSLRQAITPAPLLGRMNATMRFIVWGIQPIGSLLGGTLGTILGVVPTIWIAAIGSLFAFVPLLIGPLLSLQEIPALEGVEVGPVSAAGAGVGGAAGGGAGGGAVAGGAGGAAGRDPVGGDPVGGDPVGGDPVGGAGVPS